MKREFNHSHGSLRSSKTLETSVGCFMKHELHKIGIYISGTLDKMMKKEKDLRWNFEKEWRWN